MSIAKDLETYRSVFGKDNIVYSHTAAFIYTEKGKERNLLSSIFLTSENITIINTKYNLKYRIPLGDIINFSTEGKVLRYYVHLTYGNQERQYNASFDFTTKSDGKTFTSLLNLAIDVDKKRLELDRKLAGMSDEVDHWKQKISDLDADNKTLSKEKEKIEH